MPAIAKGQDVYAQDNDFWDKYIAGRPKIPQSFFDRIFDYHLQHHGHFEKAHEVGAGVGVHSGRLAARFQHVLVSDVIQENITIAQVRLEDDAKYEFVASSLEDTTNLPESSMDLVFASTMMHFTQIDEAVKAVYHQLKPGGTFAAGLYGTFALQDAAAQEVWAKIVLRTCEMIADQYGLDDRTKFILQNEASGLDCVGMPAEWFMDVQRFEWNFPERNTMRGMLLPTRFELEPFYRIGKQDVVVKDQWDQGWDEKHDLDGLKRIAATGPHNENDERIVTLWKELKDIIGDGEVKGAWMVCLLLATKK